MREFAAATLRLEKGPTFPSLEQERDIFRYEMAQVKALLLSMVDEVREYWVDGTSPVDLTNDDSEQESEQMSGTQVFIVHGHDDALTQSTARFVEKLRLNPIILCEQANKGRTIIEKFEEECSSVGYAICLLTPDDMGHRKDAPKEARPRARQNAILELGYFMGKLGRQRVCALHKGDVELPSDYAGVVYISADDADWKIRLVKELKAAGYDVDANQAL
jgi:predicted nucleotide-binding protein